MKNFSNTLTLYGKPSIYRVLKFFREVLTKISVKEISLTVRGVKTVKKSKIEVLKNDFRLKVLIIKGVKLLECFDQFRTPRGSKIANEILLFLSQISNYSIY